MQKIVKKTVVKSKEKTSKEDPLNPRKIQDEKLTRSYSTLSTPRSYVQKASATDIYGQPKKTTQNSKALPKKTTITQASPMKNLLKSSPSSISQVSSKSYEKRPATMTPRLKKTAEPKRIAPKMTKPLPFTNVTVKSPIVKRKLEKSFEEDARGEPTEGRERKSTRTLNEDEVKVLVEGVDNNLEMQKLTQRLSAQPKAFYVDLGSGDASQSAPPKLTAPSSESEVSYDDDFESYESDFESDVSSKSQSEVTSLGEDDEEQKADVKDEENMLDSGNFELRESQKSASKFKPANLDFIREDLELDKKVSLTDEGFQDMSSSSAVASGKTSHVDVLDRPLFIDFKKSKENRKRRLTFERLQQRAKDLLGMITLHEMSYSLLEMKPIPYDVYMATFGRQNYTQTAAQTFEDGITQEVQTEEVVTCTKWTQFPVEFSKNDVHLSTGSAAIERPKSSEEYLRRFTFLLSHKQVDVKETKNVNNEYKNNPLRVYFEQKDGVGTDKMLPQENYQTMMKNTKYSVDKLRRFLKRVEGRVSNILTTNSGNTGLDLTQSTYLPFSKGYISLDYKNVAECKFLKYRKISNMAFSETKSNLLMTVHRKCITTVAMDKCLICLWDIGVASRKPLKILVAIEDITICRFRGSTDGIFIGAMDDGSIHLWDLAEQAAIVSVASEKKPTKLVEFKTDGLTPTEIDREWNVRNSNTDYEEEEIPQFLQACAYTSSASNMEASVTIDTIVGVEMLGNDNAGYSQDGGRRVIGQACILQRMGVLTIWQIVQEKMNHIEKDLGKAYWSRMKLEKNQTICLINHIDIPNNAEKGFNSFNLTAAKRRLAGKKTDRTKKQISRANLAVNSDRPASAARLNNKPVMVENWDAGILCTDLKVLQWEKIYTYLVAKNCGEVLCCTRSAGSVRVNRFCVTSDMSTITALSTSPGWPYFLAGTDVGTIHLCSVVETRTLMSLDCTNTQSSAESEKYRSDEKGRYLGTVAIKPMNFENTTEALPSAITSIQWSPQSPCCFIPVDTAGISCCDLTRGDLRPPRRSPPAAKVAHNKDHMAILRHDDELHIHRLFHEAKNKNQEDLFRKYVSLL